MESRRFDDLTRSLASSRRGAVKTLAGLAAGGLLALLAPTEGATQRRPRRPRPPRPPRRPRNRPGICAGRRDGARCGGECGRCFEGQCLPDQAQCEACHFCDFDGLMCAPIAEGQPCGNQGCMACQDGACVAEVLEGEACGGCGRCEGGVCVPSEERCDAECEVCDADTLTCDSTTFEGISCGEACGICRGGVCIAGNEGNHCGDCMVCRDGACVGECGECGECDGGECVAIGNHVCPTPACQACDPTTFACVPFNQGGNCGGECGACIDGQCAADPFYCFDLLGLCSYCIHDDVMETYRCEPNPDAVSECCAGGVPLPDFTVCGGDCGVCQNGRCVAGGCPEPECQVCVEAGDGGDGETFICAEANEGSPCGADGTCRGGACVEQVVCPAGQRSCPAPYNGPFSCCFDTSPGSCEYCASLQGPDRTVFECRSSITDINEHCTSLGLGFYRVPGTQLNCGNCCIPSGQPCLQENISAGFPCCSGLCDDTICS